jgi:hypothetical protein
MKLSTSRFAQLLRAAKDWNERYQGMCHAQTEWLTENFCFGDAWCVCASLEDRRRWDIPKVAAGKFLYTRSG